MSDHDKTVWFGTENGDLIGDYSEAHIMTIAPTGAGKGTTSIIPNLLTWKGSAFVIDPKGENIRFTMTQRHKLNGGKVFLLDPFFIVNDHPKIIRANYNPFDFIDEGESGITQADRLADALIIKESSGDNVHFTNEARALLKALILHVRTDEIYASCRHLGRVNELASDPVRLVGDGKKPGEMQKNAGVYGGIVARIGKRMGDKSDREGPAVWSTLQANLSTFLDDPRVAGNLRKTTPGFDFINLTQDKVSIFVVLPIQYLETFSRWLRLLVGSALDRLYEGMGEEKPDIPALMVLDEFAHLGNLEAVRTAYGLVRGAGVKIWAILQSLSQLDHNYGEDGRENFIANSGAIEIFNMVDNTGCKYFSEMAGQVYATIKARGESVSTSTKAASPDENSVSNSLSHSQDLRFLMLPRDISNLGASRKLLFRRGHPYEILEKGKH